MNDGLLSRAEDIRIRIGPNREIVSASDPVFETVHQDEARTIIYEAGYLSDYLDEFSRVLGLGEAKFVAVAEQERQTFYTYEGDMGSSILLTKDHRGMKQLLKEIPA
jgi:hypothetical protein